MSCSDIPMGSSEVVYARIGCQPALAWQLSSLSYLAAVLDLHSRRVAGWSLAEHMREELVHDALSMALGRRRPEKTVLHHSDRGSQYTSEDYRQLLKRSGFDESMSRKGNCWDNAMMERCFGSLKSERTDVQRYGNRKEAKGFFIDYIYNVLQQRTARFYVSICKPEMF